MKPPTPVSTGTTLTVELPAEVGGATVGRLGALDVLFASADASGEVAALMLKSVTPGVIAVVRRDGDRLVAALRQGNLIPAGSPLVLTDATDEVRFEALATGTVYRAPAKVGPDGACCLWNQDTHWRLAADRPDAGLLRAVTDKMLTWTQIDFHAPDDPAPRWQVALRPESGPSFVADATLTRDGTRALVQLTDGKRAAQLVAYDTASGREVWRTDTAATATYWGALVMSDDGASVITVLGDAARCETCERIEERAIATGALIRTVSLDDSAIVGAMRPLGVEVYLGARGDELWARFRRPRMHSDGFVQGGVTYDAFDLRTGAGRKVTPGWATRFDDEDHPLFALPIRGGVLAVQAIDVTHLELTRFDGVP